jgi:hypothetical protein
MRGFWEGSWGTAAGSKLRANSFFQLGIWKLSHYKRTFWRVSLIPALCKDLALLLRSILVWSLWRAWILELVHGPKRFLVITPNTCTMWGWERPAKMIPSLIWCLHLHSTLGCKSLSMDCCTGHHATSHWGHALCATKKDNTQGPELCKYLILLKLQRWQKQVCGGQCGRFWYIKDD